MNPPPTPEPPASETESSPAGRDERLVVIGGIAILVLALIATLAAILVRRASTPDPGRPRWLADFRLIERSGRTVERQDLTNQFLVVGFVFTSCSLTCLEVSRNLTEVQRRTAGQDDVLLVSITVDPRTDTPEVLREFADRFDADPDRWLFLTGPKPDVHALLAASFLDQEPPSAFNAIPGGFVHTERVLLVDRQGRVRSAFDGLKKDMPDTITAELTRLRQEEKR